MNIQRGNFPPPLTIEPDPAPLPDDNGFDLRAIVAMVWQGKWIIAICLAFSLAGGLLAVAQMKPTYRASAKVLFEPAPMSGLSVQDILSNRTLARGALENEIQVLTSTNHISRVARKLKLWENLEFSHALRVGVPTKIMGTTSAGPPPITGETGPDLTTRRIRLKIIEAVRDALVLERIDNSRVVRISFEGSDPAMAARIVNTVAREYILERGEAKLVAARQEVDWLSDRVGELGARVRFAELAVEEARTAVVESVGQSAAMTRQQLQAINRALADARASLAGLEVQYANVSKVLDDPDIDLGTVTLFREAGVIRRLRQEENALVRRDARLEIFARDNPQRQQIGAALEGVRDGIRLEAERIAQALRADLDEAKMRVASLEEDVRGLEATEREQRMGNITLRQLEREAEASRSLYESFLARLEKTSQQENVQTADARILTPAEVPERPLATAKNRTLMFSLIFGGGFGLGLVVLLDRLSNTVRSADQLQSMTGLPVLASLPAVGAKVPRAEVVAHLHEKPDGPLAEAVRNMRTSVLFGVGGAAPKVVAFTSAVPREGKSTTAYLLALTCQQMGRSAIIVDCDLRLHSLSNLVQQDEEKPGLLSVVEGRARIEDAVVVDEGTGLHVLTAQGPERHAAPSAADTLSSEGFVRLVRRLSQTYDLVVLDTPPVLVVTDPRIIARVADAVVYAVRWDETPRDAVMEGLREMAGVSAPLAGLVLTMVDPQKVSGDGYERYGEKYRSDPMDFQPGQRKRRALSADVESHPS